MSGPVRGWYRSSALARAAAVLIIIAALATGCGMLELPAPPTAIPTAVPQPTASEAPTRAPTEAPATGTPPEHVTPTPASATLEIVDLPAPQAGDLVVGWISMVDSQLGWAVGSGQDGLERVLRTRDGGRVWSDVSPPALAGLANSEARIVVAAEDDQSAWALRYAPVDAGPPQEQHQALVWRSSDGGASWTRSEALALPFVGSRGDPPLLRFPEAQYGWLMVRAGGAGMQRYPVGLLRSQDVGASWQQLQGPHEDTSLQSCHKSGFAAWADGVGLITLDSCPIEGAEVRFTLDGAQSWQAATLPPPEAAPDLFQQASCESHSPQLLGRESWRVAVMCRPFADGAEPQSFLYASEDGGQSWAARTYPGGALQHVGPEAVWALSRELHYSDDGGRTWQRRKQVFWDGQFSWISPEQGWAVARQDGEIALVHSSDGGRSWQILEPSLAP